MSSRLGDQLVAQWKEYMENATKSLRDIPPVAFARSLHNVHDELSKTFNFVAPKYLELDRRIDNLKETHKKNIQQFRADAESLRASMGPCMEKLKQCEALELPENLRQQYPACIGSLIQCKAMCDTIFQFYKNALATITTLEKEA